MQEGSILIKLKLGCTLKELFIELFQLQLNIASHLNTKGLSSTSISIYPGIVRCYTAHQVL